MPATLHRLDTRPEAKQSDVAGTTTTVDRTDGGICQGPQAPRAMSQGLASRLTPWKAMAGALLVSTLLWALIVWAVLTLIH